MKKLISIIISLIFVSMITGCQKVDENWSGIYTNDSDFSVLIHVSGEDASIAVKQVGPNFVFFPIDYPNYLHLSGNELKAKNGQPVKIVKEGTKITITIESEEKGPWDGIEGEYTKVKNVKKFKFD